MDFSLLEKIHKYYLDLAGTGIISYFLGTKTDLWKIGEKAFHQLHPPRPKLRVTHIMVEGVGPNEGVKCISTSGEVLLTTSNGEIISGHVVVDASGSTVPSAIELVQPNILSYRYWDWWEFQQPDGSWGKVYSLPERKVYTLKFRANFIAKAVDKQIAWMGPFKGDAYFVFTGVKKPFRYSWTGKSGLESI